LFSKGFEIVFIEKQKASGHGDELQAQFSTVSSTLNFTALPPLSGSALPILFKSGFFFIFLIIILNIVFILFFIVCAEDDSKAYMFLHQFLSSNASRSNMDFIALLKIAESKNAHRCIFFLKDAIGDQNGAVEALNFALSQAIRDTTEFISIIGKFVHLNSPDFEDDDEEDLAESLNRSKKKSEDKDNDGKQKWSVSFKSIPETKQLILSDGFYLRFMLMLRFFLFYRLLRINSSACWSYVEVFTNKLSKQFVTC
jgi:hypothetical protein